MTWKRSGVAESQLLDVSKLLRNRPVIDTDPRIMHTREQPLNQSEFLHQRGINLFRKLPPTAAVGILMLLVRVDKCAKCAALHEIGDRSWSKHKGRDTKSQSVSVPERLCCDLNNWEEIRPTISDPKPGRKPCSQLRLSSMWRRNGESAKHWCEK